MFFLCSIYQGWGGVNQKVILPVKRHFEALEKAGVLNIDNPTDVMCLHYTFIPLIQSNLTK